MPYDPGWPAQYDKLSHQLRQAVGDRWQTEHIGSISVPGLVAKPVIDLAVRVPHPNELDQKLPVLEAIGWTDLTTMPTHLALFRLDRAGVRRAIAHLFTAEQWPTAPQRAFAAWLRTYPADRGAYANLKQTLRAGGTWGHDYTTAKAAFVQMISAKAAASDRPGSSGEASR